MRIVVVGGSGLVGSRLVASLVAANHDALDASPSSGVNTLSGEGLAAALEGADVVVDVTNSPSFEDAAVMDFFKTSTTNVLSAEAKAATKHHIVLGVVGTDRLTQSGYFRAKLEQERLINESPIPFTIVRATQFFEFLAGIADAATTGTTVRLPPACFQPIAVDEVVRQLHDVVESVPLNAILEVGGPEPLRIDELVREFLESRKDQRVVVADTNATYFGARLSDYTLVPSAGARLSKVHFDEWLVTDRETGARSAASIAK